MSETNTWFFPRGSLRSDGWDTLVDGSLPGWAHTGLRIADLDGDIALSGGPVERMVVPLRGGPFTVVVDEEEFVLSRRGSVFDGPGDTLVAGVGTALRISGIGRVAVAEAPADRAVPVSVLRAADCPVEVRGRGRSTRQVHNFGVPGGLDAARLIVCEVITPAENWSSYPGHKHDEATGTESRLEEIYYFETRVAAGLDAPPDADPFGLFCTYSSPAGSIDTAAMVRSGDVALVPYGYHGPAAAAPGYDLYYLNVMAGPDAERAWRISDDPAHGWIRETWNDQSPDPRLPMTPKDPR